MKYIITILLLSVFTLSSQNTVSIYWDSSSSMDNRDLNLEYEFLDSYFKYNPNIEVKLILFNFEVYNISEFNINNSDWSNLKISLESVVNDGASSFNKIPNTSKKEDDILLFTDGEQTIYATMPIFRGNLKIINSSENYNFDNLNLIAFNNKGKIINLIEKNKKKQKKQIDYNLNILSDEIIQEEISIFVNDKIYNKVIVKEKRLIKVRANRGDKLTISVVGYGKLEKKLQANQNINMWIENNSIQLDEVLIKSNDSQLEEQLTETSLGLKDKNPIGYDVNTIDDEDISEINKNVAEAVQDRFSGITSIGQQGDLSTPDLGKTIIRGYSTITQNNYGMIIIDGVPIARNKSNNFSLNSIGALEEAGTSFIDPNNIASITVLKGLAATNLYGQEGSNGVILIKTKTASYKTKSTPIDQLALKNNIYDGKVITNNDQINIPYLNKIKENSSVKNAYLKYLDLKSANNKSPSFYIDVFDFFMQSNKKLAFRILSNILEKQAATSQEIRAAFFKTNQYNNYKMNLEIAKRQMELYPQSIQSYLDLALAYKNSDRHQESLNMLLKISDGSINTSLNFKGLSKNVDNEIRNLIFKNKSILNLKNVPSKYINNVKYDVRLVIDWNNNDAAFDFQFVNPSKRFFSWEHSLNNSKRIKDETKNGYSREEFFIAGDNVKGQWLVNVIYKGSITNKEKTPLFINYTLDSNFGKPNQSTRKGTLRIDKNSKEKLLVKFTIK